MTATPLPDLDLCFVEGGEFMMGDDNGADDHNKPAHRVRLSSFSIGKYPVTQRLWQEVMKNNPSRFKDKRRRVERVSWYDTQVFLSCLNQITGKTFRLPTEAEWEYAARGGKYSYGYKYAGSDRDKQAAWHLDNSFGETPGVGLLLPNELDLHDQNGNVFDWCADWHSSEYYTVCHQIGTVENPLGPDSGSGRVVRGGGWIYAPKFTRAVRRYWSKPDLGNNRLGFRLVLPFQAEH